MILALAPAALGTDLAPLVSASIHDEPPDGLGDSFNASPFEGLLRRQSTRHDRAIQEFHLAPLGGQPITAATLSGRISVNNAFDNGPRGFDFLLYAGNGAADLSDFQIPATFVGVGSYHPPSQTSFNYSFDVTAVVQSLVAGGATWIGLRVQCNTDPNFPNILDETISRLAVTIPSSAGTPFCFGGLVACPCGNAGSAGNGCASSVNPLGAHLAGTGLPSLTNDTLVLRGSGMPNSNALYFQGTAQVNAGAGAPFGDGLRCAGGTIVRLEAQANVAGASVYPDVGELPVSLRGVVSAPGLRTYQIWYRNAAAFCTPDTFNLTNGLEIAWAP
jgi:hypothetical protein